MAASEVDFPEPVEPTMMTRPRLVITTSFRTGGRLRSSNFGMVVVIVRSTMPMRPCCMKALTRKRPIPPGLMAKLHSLVASNSPACLSFIIARVSSAVCCGVSAWLATGVILPSSLIAGGKPEVMNRSDAFLATIARRRSCMNLTAWSRSICPPSLRLRSAGPEKILVHRLAAGLFRGNDVALDQLLQVLVQRLHAVLLPGLDRRVHLRHLGLADQVANRRRADHDLVRRDAPGAILGLQQRLRDHGAQRFRQHRAH